MSPRAYIVLCFVLYFVLLLCFFPCGVGKVLCFGRLELLTFPPTHMDIIHELLQIGFTHPVFSLPAASLFKDRLMRLEDAKIHSSAFADFLVSKGCFKHAEALRLCADKADFIKPSPVNDRVGLLVPYSCGNWRICNVCSIRRMNRYLVRFVDILMEQSSKGVDLSLCTFTVANHVNLRTAFDRLVTGIRAMTTHRRNTIAKSCRNAPIEFTKVLGYICAIEVKRGYNLNLWHPHAHMIIAHSRFHSLTPRLLSKEWERFSNGAGFIVDVRPISSERSSIVECIKYPIAFDQLPYEDIFHAWKVLKGERMLSTCGCFRGFTLPDDDNDVLPPDDFSSSLSPESVQYDTDGVVLAFNNVLNSFPEGITKLLLRFLFSDGKYNLFSAGDYSQYKPIGSC